MSRNQGAKSSRNLASSALLFSIDGISALVFSFISLAAVAKQYGPEVYGQYSLAQSVSTLFVVLVTWGLEPFIIREVARSHQSTKLVLPIIITMSTGWVVYALAVFAFFLLGGEGRANTTVVAAVVAATFFTKALYLRLHLQAKGNGLPIALGAVVSRFVAAAYLIASVAMNCRFEITILYLPLQASVCALVIYVTQRGEVELIRPGAQEWRRILQMIKEAFPYFLSTAIFFAYTQTDIIFLSKMYSKHDVGVYAAAAKLVPLVGFISFSLVAAYYPSLESALRDGVDVFWEKVAEVSRVLVVVGLLGILAVFLMADIIISLMYGAEFAVAALYLKLLSVTWVFSLPAALYSRVVVMLGQSRIELIKMAIVGPLVLLVMWFSVKLFGPVGAAISVVGSYAVVDLLIYFCFPKTRRIGFVGARVIFDAILRPYGAIKGSVGTLLSRQK